MVEEMVTLAVEQTQAGERLDVVLVTLLAQRLSGGASRTQVQRWISQGQVLVNERPETRPGARLPEGARLVVTVPTVNPLTIESEDIPLTILFEDQYLLCINKPAGLTVHPGAGQKNGTLLNALVHYLGSDKAIAASQRPWIVHRLDKDTSGVLIIAKNDSIHRALSAQFQDRVVDKEYRALVLTTPRQRIKQIGTESGVIESSLMRHPKNRTKMTTAIEGGRSACTRWHVIERFEYGVLLSVKIETGRTHQIRVHFDSIGAPVIGDRLYGNFSGLPASLQRIQDAFGRQALHAFRLSLTHPISKQRLSVEAPLPADLSRLIEVWREFA